jgi:uncharacterized membrane protein YgaE (UPF0421/DUF939 family)
VASTIVLSIVPGERSRRAVEMVVGIAVGIGVADLIIQAIGSGAAQIGIVVLLAVSAAILLGAGRVLASQAAATAVLVAALPASNQAFTRFTDALIGGLVGLVVLIVAPRNPVIPIRDEVESLLREVAGALEDVARALDQHDPDIATAAIVRANGAGSLGTQFEKMLRRGRETTLLAPAHWSSRISVDRYEAASRHIESATRDVGVIARARPGAWWRRVRCHRPAWPAPSASWQPPSRPWPAMSPGIPTATSSSGRSAPPAWPMLPLVCPIPWLWG